MIRNWWIPRILLMIVLVLAFLIGVGIEKANVIRGDYFHAVFFLFVFAIGILGITEVGMKPLFRLYDRIQIADRRAKGIR